MGTLHAQALPFDLTLETLENADSEWWQALSVQTVPGVQYHLQESPSLSPDDWTILSSSYGTGGNWICPVFPGSAPSSPPPPGNPILPPANSTPVKTAYLTIERSETGGTLVSWNSLDDSTPLRKLIPNIILDPVWDEFESFYLDQHGDYFFALCPRLGTPVAFTETSVTLGILDTAMLADFTAALPAITDNIQNSVAAAASFSPQPLQSESRAFFRIVADWSVDSDFDGRFDWQEIMFDGNNPFVIDSDGDGVSDADEVAQGTNPTSPSSYSLAWRRVERNLTYDFTLGDGPQANTGTLALNATWNAALNQSEALTSPIAFTSLEGRLAALSFPGGVPTAAFTGLLPAEGNASIPISDLNARNATLKHQRVWLTRSPAKDYTFEKKAVVFTDRSLNGSKQDPIFELKTFTLPANQTVSNPVDLEGGFTSDGPASGSNPPGSGNAAIPGDHSESFTKQLVPIQLEDDQFATGVDNVSITAATSDIGHQDKFWIMAPPGNDPAGNPCANSIKFNIPFVPSVEMEIVPPSVPNPTATLDPATFTLGASSPCVWRGVGADTTELAIVWKLGLAGPPAGAKQNVVLPIGVKLMKRRTVKVAVHEIASVFEGREDDHPDLMPTPLQIQNKLNEIFGSQINAWFDIHLMPVKPIAFDVADADIFVKPPPAVSYTFQALPPEPGNRKLEFVTFGWPEASLVCADRPAGYDIHVFIVGGASPIQTYSINENRELYIEGAAAGIASIGENYCIVDGDRDGKYSNGEFLLRPERRTVDDVILTVAHEIGHVMFLDHPDENKGPAPLLGTDRTKRLMCSGLHSNSNSKLLVKKEWDKAEDWLKENPDVRIRLERNLGEDSPTGNY